MNFVLSFATQVTLGVIGITILANYYDWDSIMSVGYYLIYLGLIWNQK